MAEHNDFGELAEELAADFLQKSGYKILLRNFRHLKAEIDIIAEYEDQIIIVEVKARKTDVFLEPHEAVNRKKIRLIVSAADFFIQENKIEKEARFDIISVLPNEKGQLEINHLINAFDATAAQ